MSVPSLKDIVKDEFRTTNESCNELKQFVEPFSARSAERVSEGREDRF